MKLANPIYDVVLRYLIKDIEVTKLLLSQIIREEILTIKAVQHEPPIKADEVILVSWFSFEAIIKTKKGKGQKAYVELQVANQLGDVFHFRSYLMEHYPKMNVVKNNNNATSPIYHIYVLKFRLKNLVIPFAQSYKNYESLIFNIPNELVKEPLCHTSIIQIPRLAEFPQDKMLPVFKVFNQQNRSYHDSRFLILPEVELNKDSALKKVADCLMIAGLDENLLVKMDIEEEVEARIEKHVRRTVKLKAELKKKTFQSK